MKKRYSKKTPWIKTQYSRVFVIRALKLHARTGLTKFSTNDPWMKSGHDKLLPIGDYEKSASDKRWRLLIGESTGVNIGCVL